MQIRTYANTKAHFELMRETGEQERVTAKEQADEFLDRVGKTREAMQQSNRATLLQQRNAGHISRGTTDEQLQLYADRSGWQTAAVSLLNETPSVEAYSYMEAQVRAAEDPRGASYTAKHGYIAGSAAAKQRARNTRMAGAEGLHSADCGEDAFEKDTRRAIKKSILDDGHCDPEEMWQATFNSEQSERLRVQTEPRGITPTYAAAASAPPAPVVKVASKKTPVEVEEVRDEATIQVCIGSGSASSETLQDVVDDLTRPYNQQTMKVHDLLVKKGKDVDERIDGLANWVETRKKRGA